MKDNDWAGHGNHYDYGFRSYDPRIGRFLSNDPLTSFYPWNSPYNYAEDRPIDGMDVEGREWQSPEIYARKHWYGRAIAFSVDALQAAGLATVQTLAFFTQVWEHGNHNPNAMSLHEIGNTIVGGPLQVTNNLIKDPGNGANWGAFAVMAVGGKMAKDAGVGFDALVGKRVALASAFYEKSGVTDPAKASSHMDGIDFNKPVQTVTLKAGTIVQQWVGREIGNYFTTLENGAAHNLGIKDYSARTLTQFKLSKDIQVLKSTAADYKGNQGGATQFFSKEIKDNSTNSGGNGGPDQQTKDDLYKMDHGHSTRGQ